MIVLSLFDGMACGYEALKTAGIFVEKYYASEIDPYAIKIAKKNHPDIIHLGDVTKWHEWSIPKPDLIIGGSPCQGFSFAGKQLAFDDPRSKLFFEMTDIIRYYNPQFKLLENVKMKKEFLDIITDFMDCGEPHFINSALVSAQNRQRYYWYNWEAPEPIDRGILLADIIENGDVGLIKDRGELKIRNEKSMCIDANYYKGVDNHGQRTIIGRQYPRGKNAGFEKEISKSPTMSANSWQQNFNIREKSKTIRVGGRSSPPDAKQNWDAFFDGKDWRKLTPIECERLQTLPDNYTKGVSDTQRYRMLGNGWTKDVIAHLFSHMPISDVERMMQ